MTVKMEGDWVKSVEVWVYDGGERVWGKKTCFGDIELQMKRGV